MTSNVCITVDMEQDVPPFMSTYRGIEEGAPRLLKLLAEESIPAPFFTTGDVARRYPQIVDALVKDGHELGCHGDTHRRFSTMNRDEARTELRDAGKTLRAHADVISFRAPNLDFPSEFVPLLRDEGFAVDSSCGRHKRGSYFIKPVVESGVRRIPASMSPSPLRTPKPIRRLICGLLDSPTVLFVHPWEFIDLRDAPLRFDIRVRTGDAALDCLRDTIRYYKRKNANFQRIREVSV